jgi:hypothetical protein
MSYPAKVKAVVLIQFRDPYETKRVIEAIIDACLDSDQKARPCGENG